MRTSGIVVLVLSLSIVSACTSSESLIDHPAPHGNHGGGGKSDSGTTFWWIGASADASSALPNAGIRTTFEVVNAPPEIGCIDSWTSETVSNGVWGQIGYSACRFSDTAASFTAFYQVWNAAGDEVVDGEASITEGLHSFAMSRADGTRWAFAMDGQAFGSYDMGAELSDGTSAQTLREEGNGVPAPYLGPSTFFPEVMSVLHEGAWMQPSGAVVYNTAGIPGVVGTVQDAALATNQMIIGSPGAVVPVGVALWRSPLATSTFSPVVANPTVPYLVLDAPTEGVMLSGEVSLVATATTTAGLANVAFYIDSGSTPLCTCTAAPCSCSWNTTETFDGSHYVSVSAQDLAGNVTWVNETMLVHNAAH